MTHIAKPRMVSLLYSSSSANLPVSMPVTYISEWEADITYPFQDWGHFVKLFQTHTFLQPYQILVNLLLAKALNRKLTQHFLTFPVPQGFPPCPTCMYVPVCAHLCPGPAAPVPVWGLSASHCSAAVPPPAPGPPQATHSPSPGSHATTYKPHMST